MKRPNKLGRIEGEPKVNKFKTLPWKAIGVTVAAVALVYVGILGTLKYQGFIASTEQKGVNKYVAQHCKEYTDKDNKAHWLECDVQ